MSEKATKNTPGNEGLRIAFELVEQAKADNQRLLDLGQLGLTAIPEDLASAIVGLKQLKTLSLGKMYRENKGWVQSSNQGQANQLTVLPMRLAQMVGLEQLFLTHNKVRNLMAVAKLPALRTLDLAYNQLSSADLLNMPVFAHVIDLYIRGNHLVDLSFASRFPKLKFISASKNNIADATGLIDFAGLELAYLSDNALLTLHAVELPPNLQVLDVANNRLTSVDQHLLTAEQLEAVDFSGNAFKDIPSDILADLESLRKHFNIYVRSGEGDEVAEGEETATATEQAQQEEFVEAEEAPPPPESAAPSAKGAPPNVVASRIITQILRTASHPREVLLGARQQAAIFAEVLANSNKDEEQFFGLFGRWGRGKTFFWEATHDYIKAHHGDKFEAVDFHAWKYQDTPAIWAYLYEVLVEYYNPKPQRLWRVDQWIGYLGRLIRHNYHRKNVVQPLLAGLGLAITLWAATTLIKTDNLDQLELFGYNLLGSSATAVTLYALWQSLRKGFGTKANQFFRTLTTRHSYATQLGLQHEIQNELKALLRAWCPAHGDKRILIFVDDIDRCQEGKIVEIVDAIRVMLHDPGIQKRVTVLAAIDERILLRAIRNKYKETVEEEKLDQISREYMDKLFIAGLKLGPLNVKEKREVLRGFTGAVTNPDYRVVAQATNETEADLQPDNEALKAEQRIPADNEPTERDTAYWFQQTEPATSSTDVFQAAFTTDGDEGNDPAAETASRTIEYQLEKEEEDLLTEGLQHFHDATPRAIRVYTIRYRLGQNLLEKLFEQGDGSGTEWHNGFELKKYFAWKLIQYGHGRKPIEIIRTMHWLEQSTSSEVTGECFGTSFTMQRSVALDIYKVLSMVVAY